MRETLEGWIDGEPVLDEYSLMQVGEPAGVGAQGHYL